MTKFILSRLLATSGVLFEHHYMRGKSEEVLCSYVARWYSLLDRNVISSLNSDVSCENRTNAIDGKSHSHHQNMIREILNQYFDIF